MRVLLIDNQTHVRASLQFLLDQQPGIHLIGTAEAGTMLLEGTYALRPAVALISWELWHKLGNDLLNIIRMLDLRPKVIVFSSRPEVQQIALASGADAFFCAYDPPETLLAILQTTGASGASHPVADIDQ